MSIGKIDDIERLKRINEVLIARVEQSMDQQGNAFSLFQTAINLEGRIKARTEELRATLRRLEQTNVDLIAAKEAAEIANLSKTRFLAAASHDVLQPLNAARLSISALADQQETGEGKRLARQVERSLDTMEELLRTLLDMSKLDAGVVRPQLGDVALETLFQSLESDFAPLAAAKGLRLRFRPTSLAVATDRSMFRRILQNIISNAIRYTSRGGVIVGARVHGGQVRVDIADTGSGIPSDQFEAVFEEFHRGPGVSDPEAQGGLGLGLTIVRRMTQALDHELDFSSIVGRGTVFKLRLPKAAGEVRETVRVGGESERPRAYGLDGARVLLVENDPPVLEAMEMLLDRWGCSVRSATDIDGALAHLVSGDFVPDIVIADQHLDHGDLGTAAITEARRVTRRAVPALIVTADFSEDLGQIARGMHTEVMRKPVKPAQLRALMAHMLA